MKEGNQFYLELQICDENNELLDINTVQKIQFNIGNLTKIYDGTNEDIIYDDENKIFKIWLTEEETFKFKDMVNIEARILFKDNNAIGGTYIENIYWYDTIAKEKLDV